MSAKQKLLQLLYIQLEHDKYFHPDILSLPVQRRFCHVTLHFAIYAGNLTIAKHEHDRDLLLATLVDVFIICLTVGNMFNKKLSDLDNLSKLQDEQNIGDFAKRLPPSEKISKEDIFTYAAEMLTIEAGKMAKAIESLDHLESYPYKESVIEGLNKIVEIVIVSFSFMNIDVYSKVCSRLEMVEKKSIFYSMFREQEKNKNYQI